MLLKHFAPFLTTVAVTNTVAAVAQWEAHQWVAFFSAATGFVAAIASILRGKTPRKKPTKGRRKIAVRPPA